MFQWTVNWKANIIRTTLFTLVATDTFDQNEYIRLQTMVSLLPFVLPSRSCPMNRASFLLPVPPAFMLFGYLIPQIRLHPCS